MIKKIRGFILIGATVVCLAASKSMAVPPAALTTLTGMEGQFTGEVDLSWISPKVSFTEYIIRYRTNGLILSETDWISADRIDNPPLFWTQPPVGSTNTLTHYTIGGLVPGLTHYFAIRYKDTIGSLSLLDPGSTVGITPKSTCIAGANDGEGVATILPTSFETGEVVQATMTFTVASSGIQTGGSIAMRVPDFWESPQTTSSQFDGYVSFSSAASNVELTLNTSNQLVIVNVSSGSLMNGEQVFVHYLARTCDLHGNPRFEAFSQQSECGQLVSLQGANNIGAVSLSAGPPRFVSIEPYEQYIPISNRTPMTMEVQDLCGEVVPATAPINVDIMADFYNTGTGMFDPDTDAEVSLTTDFTNANQSTTAVINVSETSKTFYYQINSVSNPNDHFINLNFLNFGSQVKVVPIAAGGAITNLSVDTGIIPTNPLTTVSFSPNFDGTDDVVFINFDLPSAMPYRLQVYQTTPNPDLLVEEFHGFGSSERISWDGYSFFYNSIAPPDLYRFEIEVDGGVIVDTTTLTATLISNGVRGTVVNKVGSVPIENALVNIWGPTGHQAFTSSNGTFTVYGLQLGGQYFVEVQKTGFTRVQTNFVATSGLHVLPSNIELDAASLINIHAIRPSAPFLPEIHGEVRAHNSDWSQQAFGNIHFNQGSTGSDAGDFYNTVQSSLTTLSVAPNVDFTVEFDIPNHTAPTIPTINLGVGMSTTIVVNLSRAANIEGSVFLPSGGNPNGLWVSVDACGNNSCSIFDPTKRFYGGVWLSAGEESGVYRIFGVPADSYELQAFVPGYVKGSTFTVVSGTNDVTGVDFSTFSTGGILVGTVTVNGDTTRLDELDGQTDGQFKIYMHMEARSSPFVHGGGEVTLSTHATQSVSTYSISGLNDGTYTLFTHLPGFELNPPRPPTVVISGGSGIQDLNFRQHSGAIVGTIVLPSGATNYSDVDLELTPFHSGGFQDIEVTTITDSGTFIYTGLGTEFYSLQGFYPTNGIFIEKNLQVTNGSTTTVTLNFNGSTYSITGRITTSASSPYNTLNYIVNQTTPTSVFNVETETTTVLPANRIVARRILESDFNSGPGGPEDGGPGNGPDSTNGPNNNSSSNLTQYDPLIEFIGTYNATSGTYTITNLSPGAYEVYNNGEMDGDDSNGPEIAQVSQFITVFGNKTDVNFNLSDGFSISGNLRILSGESESGRNFEVFLRNRNGETVGKREPVFLTGTSKAFTLEKIPPGSYVLTAEDIDSPKKYSSREISVLVEASNLTNKNIDVVKAAQIRGQLRIKETGTLITSLNANQNLPQNLNIEARANPWFQGGFHQSERFNNGTFIDSDDKFTVITNEGSFDLIIRAFGDPNQSEIAQGIEPFIPITISGINVTAGEIKDLGIIELINGETLTGVVTDENGAAIPNLLVEAEPANGDRDIEPLRAFTNEQGSYTIYGIDPGDPAENREGTRYYFVIAAPRPSPHDPFADTGNIQYGEEKQFVDTQNQLTGINFVLSPALGSISGRIITPDNGELILPFHDDGLPGAEIILNKEGNIPTDNPLGDIEWQTDPNGRFQVKGLAAGNYTLYALAAGYGSYINRNIVVVDSDVSIGTGTLTSGHKLFGTLTKQDGSSVNQQEVNVIVAARSGFEDIIIGNFELDASGNILSYTLSGFKDNESYSVLAFNDDDDVFNLASNVVLTNDTERNLTLTERPPTVFAQSRNLGGTPPILELIFEFTKPLRNSETDLNSNEIPDDSECALLFTRISGEGGTGSLDCANNFNLASNRKRATLQYQTATGETSFTIQSSVTFNTINQATGLNYTSTKTFTFYIGIQNQQAERLLNARAGEVGFQNDASRFVTQPGTFGNQDDLEVEVIFRAAVDQDDITPLTSSSDQRIGALSVAQDIGLNAYPGEMSSAMVKALATEIDPFGSFYDIFLPASVSHFFPEGKEAQLCLTYDASKTSDPHALNIYYYNTQTDEYLIENANKRVDTDNTRICVDISHASVFTVLNSSASVFTGTGYSGPLTVFNFPNPFNLKPKGVTLQSDTSPNRTINGTMIKMSIPSTITGTVELEIFNVAGEKVRTLTQAVNSGAHNYMQWDGRNDSGKKVSSGIYIARFLIGGGNERFFKMAVIK